MAHALTLCKTGIITVEMIRASKESNRPVMFTKTINKASGKESYKETAFSFTSWGHKTMLYLAMIREDLHESSRQKIKARAHEHYKHNRRQLSSADTLSMDESEQPRRRVHDVSDDEN